MPVIKSVKKALRSADRRKKFNQNRKDNLRNSTKEMRALLATQNKKEALEKLPKAYKAIDKAAKRGIIKKNTAARKKSRLTKAIAKLK